MVQLDKRLLWHPRHENKFVVGGNSQITLYEWASEFPKIRHVTSQHDLQFMKCFAWSPDPSFEDLLAVGTSTGKVDLIRLEAAKQAGQNSVLTSGPSVSLSVRNSRACNALAFSYADPNYLAVGLDKVRGDPSLVIWDIISTSPLLSLSSASNTDEVLPAGVSRFPSRPQPQIPRAENHPRIDSRILQQHAPTEIVSSLTFLPASTHLLLAGISHRWLRLFDLRTASPYIINVASKVLGMATDPFDPHRIACFGDGAITIWDARKLAQPVLMFSERDATADGARIRTGSSYINIEFSSTRRGCLASLERDSRHVRFWDLAEARGYVPSQSGAGGGGSSDGDNKGSRESSRATTRRSWANLPWPTADRQSESQQSLTRESSISSESGFSPWVLTDTRRTKTFSRPLASFALVPNLGSSHPLTSNVMVVNKEGDLEVHVVHDSPKQASWSARGSLLIGSGADLKVVEGYKDEALEDDFDSEAVKQSSYRHSGPSEKDTSRSRSVLARDESLLRGRAGKSGHIIAPLPVVPSPPPPFGRGDDDGFPALGDIVTPTGLSATRPEKPRTYSPASMRKLGNTERHDFGSRRRSFSPPPPTVQRVKAESRGRGRDSSPSAARRKHKGRREGKTKGINHIVEQDISMIMRRRVLRGYGLSQPQNNMHVTQDDHELSDGSTQSLSELWAWILHSHELLSLPTPRLHGYDLSYQGLQGIWDGIPPMAIQSQPLLAEDTPVAGLRPLLLDLPPPGFSSHPSYSSSSGNVLQERQTPRRSHSPVDDLHGNWQAALATLASRRSADRSSWKPTVATAKLVQRQIALQLCGWSLREDELKAAIKKWEKEGKFSRAACWLVFTKQYSKAVDLLMRSDDESNRMMSGTVAALAPQASSGTARNMSVELREHCERLIVRLHDPYFRIMLTHLALGDWSEVLEEEVIPFQERLAIAFQFLEDKSLSSYLRRTTERACLRGDIDAIIVTGLTPSGLDILQSYVDCTGDVQTAAIMSSYVCPQKFKDRRAGRWLETYRDLLDGFKLHHHRVGFDIERGQLLSEARQSCDMAPEEWVPRQILIRCHYCNKSVNSPGILLAAHQTKGRPTACPNCNRALPRCSVCLMTLGIVHDPAREIELGYSQDKDTIEEAIVICQTCRHGGHAAHILEWFMGEGSQRSRGVCPVADCDCRCADE